MPTIIDQVVADAIENETVRRLASECTLAMFEVELAKMWPSLCTKRLQRNAELIGLIAESPATTKALLRVVYDEISAAAKVG